MGSAHPQPIESKCATAQTKKLFGRDIAKRRAHLAYLKVMLGPDAPQLGTAEHRAILLLRNIYPNSRENKTNSKIRVAQLAVQRRFKMEYGSKVLPYKVWAAVTRGIGKMTQQLSDETLYEMAVNDTPVGDATLLLAVNRLLVLPESHDSPLQPRKPS